MRPNGLSKQSSLVWAESGERNLVRRRNGWISNEATWDDDGAGGGQSIRGRRGLEPSRDSHTHLPPTTTTTTTYPPPPPPGPDGQYYLFPRLVAKGNFSPHRHRTSEVHMRLATPRASERLGIALEPETDYELRPDGSGGCEDPRITFGEDIKRYVMTYTALSPEGPRIALAISEDLFHWQRLGLATFRPYEDIKFDGVDNKDASVFPVAIPDPDGKPAMAILHRPLFPGTRPEETVCQRTPRVVDRHRESIWISYCPLGDVGDEPYHLSHFTLHNRLASPVAPWEQLKIGCGTPPILTRHGWMVIYHGVHELAEPSDEERKLCYSAGVLVLSQELPAGDPLSFARAGVDTGITGGMHRDRRQRRLPDRHRPTGRSRLNRSIRRLLRDGRQPDRCCASRRAGVPAARGSRRPSPSQERNSSRRST